MLRSQLFQHAPTMETCIGKSDTGLLKEKRKKEKKTRFSPMHTKITPLKVVAAHLVLDRHVVDDELLIHDPVAEFHEPDREVFASIAVAALPC